MNFQDKVYRITRQIPKGKVTTYGAIAKMAGSPNAARAVGLLMKLNPDAPRTPCHRVVAIDGGLTGYSAKGGLTAKRKILLSEGVEFKKNKADLAKSLWTA